MRPPEPCALPRRPLRPLAAAFALAFAIHAALPAHASSPPHTLVVGNCDDSGAGSLRDAVDHAVDDDTIDLTQLSCSTISLSTGAIFVGVEGLTLHGPGHHALMIQGFGDSGSSLIYDLGGGLLAIDGIDLSFGAKYRSDHAAHGGCVYTNGDLRVTDSHVYACTVHAATYDASGGALHASGSVSLDRVTVEASGPTTFGTAKGGCVFAGDDLTITNSRISGCRNAAGTQGMGGGAYAGGNLLMKYSTIDGNENDDAGSAEGGGLFVRGNSTIYWSTISNNRAHFGGGLATGFDNVHAVFIGESTISGNEAGHAGGIGADMTTTIENSTIAFNRIPHSDSIPLDYSPSAGVGVRASTTITSTIVANNVIYGDDGDEAADIGGTQPSPVAGSNNLFMSTAQPVPPDTISDDPHLRPLADNGGSTWTHAIYADSAAIDRGIDDGYAIDQRGSGFARILGDAADIGAFEADPDAVDTDLIFADGFD
ncbi:MAG: choice-of-anchor Q domain-containing protein [Rhodanobacteraceae bacterium]